jgi:hypothetical protein
MMHWTRDNWSMTASTCPSRKLARAGRRRARLLSPYREHIAKHFADTFSRIGLPEPYDTKF